MRRPAGWTLWLDYGTGSSPNEMLARVRGGDVMVAALPVTVGETVADVNQTALVEDVIIERICNLIPLV